MRAICDERISLPMDAFKDHPEVYAKIAEVIPIGDMMDVKVAWSCNTSQYWHCEVSSSEAGPIYHKLGYSAQAITAMGLNPYGGPITLTAHGAKLLGEGGAHSPGIWLWGPAFQAPLMMPITVPLTFSTTCRTRKSLLVPARCSMRSWGYNPTRRPVSPVSVPTC